MDTFLGLTSTMWTGLYTILTFGLLVVAVAAAVYAQRQWATARAISREATRPYVIVNIEASGAGPQLVDIVAKNIGTRPAFEVKLSFDPPLLAARTTPLFDPTKAKMLTESIAMIAPGQEMRIFFDDHRGRAERRDLPLAHNATVTYRDAFREQFHDEYILDFDAHRGGSYVDVKTVHDIGKTLDEIHNVLRRASVLAKGGNLDVQAAVESRERREARKSAENLEQIERIHRHDELRRQQGAASAGADGAAGVSEGE